MPRHERRDSVLLVEDDESVQTALARFLAEQRYAVHVAASGEEALKQLRRHPVAVMLCDIQLPGGGDLVPEALTMEPDLAIVLLTSDADASAAAGWLQRGAMDYLIKPIDFDTLGLVVQYALDRRQRLREDRPGGRALKEELATTRSQLEHGHPPLDRSTGTPLEALVNALEARDPYLRGHSARVADLCAAMAAQVGLAGEQVEQVRQAGQLHDVGTIGIWGDILHKQGRLTREEVEHVRQHVIIGARVLAGLGYPGEVIAAVRSHHERWDGTGYPDGLRGEAIPIGGRIICAAEIYDALSAARPYRSTKLTLAQAVDGLAKLSGSVLDPKVQESLASVMTQRQTITFRNTLGGENR